MLESTCTLQGTTNCLRRQHVTCWDCACSLGTSLVLNQAYSMILLMHDSCSVIAEALAEEVCQGGAATNASDAHAAASSSDHESGILISLH